MLRVALTGGIASGKSTVAQLFRDLGVPVIDADEIARDVVRPGSAGLQQLVGHFGESILDDNGALRRDALRELVFSSQEARATVNRFLHPAIIKEIEQRIAALDTPYVIVEIPLLAETGLDKKFDRVVVVDVPEAVQRQRLVERDNVTEAAASAAINAQATRSARLQLATDIIENTSTLDSLHSHVRILHRKFLDISKRFASATRSPSK